MLSADGVKPDPQKVEAIIAMPTPANREDLQRFLGVVTYLSKFTPNMFQKSAALRQLLQKDVEWARGQVEEDTFTCLKTSISSAPVLKFFDPKEPVTLLMQVHKVLVQFFCRMTAQSLMHPKP